MNIVEPIRSLDEIEKMKLILKEQSTRDYFLFVLGINSGMKFTELLKIRFGDLIKDNVIVSSVIFEGVEYEINAVVKECLAIYKCDILENENSINLHVFKSRKGNNPIDRSHAYRVLNKAAKKAELSYKIGTHTLRKTYGYQHYKKYGDIKYLQRLFRHNSVRHTFDYIGIDDSKIEKIESYELNI